MLQCFDVMCVVIDNCRSRKQTKMKRTGKNCMNISTTLQHRDPLEVPVAEVLVACRQNCPALEVPSADAY